MIDEDKLKKLLHEVVNDISKLIMPNHYTTEILTALNYKIHNANLTKEASDQ